MKKIIFVKPALEVDAVFDPIRSTIYLGIWYLASLLKEKGHQVWLLDEVSRNNGMEKRLLYQRKVVGSDITEVSLEKTPEEFQRQKMRDFQNLSSEEFVKKYSAFKDDGSICRNILRIGNSIEETLVKIKEIQPDFVGIPLIASANYLPAVRMGNAIKNEFPLVKIIFGGQHVSAEPARFLEENPWIDYLITGDAISVIDDIIEGKIAEKIVNGGFEVMKQFPFLDPSIIKDCEYDREPNYAFSSSGRKTVDYMFSKGCFRHCEFCMAGCQKGNHVTCIDYQKVDKQLEIFKESGIEEIIVQDDAFIFKPKTHLVEILRLMKKHGFYWQNNGGIDFELLDDFVTDQFIRYNKIGKGRITALYIPFNPRLWNKGQSAAESMVEKHRKNFENLKRLREEGKIFVFTSEIVGTPEQTMEILEHDITLHKDMIQKGYLDAVYTLVATLLPGTKWNTDNHEKIINEKDYPGYSLFTVHHKTKNITDPRTLEEIIIKRAKELNKVQKSYHWGSPFSNC